MPIFGNIYDAQKIENGEPVAEDEKMAEPGETRRVREPVVDEKGVDDYEDVRIGKPTGSGGRYRGRERRRSEQPQSG